MKGTIIKSATLASFILISGFANADTVITPKQAKRFYDEIKTVCGRVKASVNTEVIDGKITRIQRKPHIEVFTATQLVRIVE